MQVKPPRIHVSDVDGLMKVVRDNPKEFSNGDAPILDHVDVHYNVKVPGGNMKMRAVHDVANCMVFYVLSSKASSPTQMNESIGKSLHEHIRRTIGTKIVVKKRRYTWLWKGRVYVRLDLVGSLGNFLTLIVPEGVHCPPRDLSDLFTMLGLHEAKNVERTYGSLLMSKGRRTSPRPSVGPVTISPIPQRPPLIRCPACDMPDSSVDRDFMWVVVAGKCFCSEDCMKQYYPAIHANGQ